MPAKKKLLILSSLGGYGHIAAANTLISLLGKEFDIDIEYPIKDIRLYRAPAGESFYNFLLARNLIRTTNWIVRNITFRLFANREAKICNLIESYLEVGQYDLVISVIPFFNYHAAEAARRQGLPFLLVTTDNDLHHWVFCLEKNRHANYKVTIGSDLPTSRTVLENVGVSSEMIETIGLPLRPSFLQLKNRAELQKKYGVPEGKKVVLLMLGGVGSKKAYEYARKIIESQLDLHLVVCSGRNKRIARKLGTLVPSWGNTIDVRPFTRAVDELFAISDLVITKPGPGTINEAIVFELPILVDQSDATLFWEQANVDLIKSKKIGDSIRSLEDIPAQLHHFLHDEEVRKEVAQAYKKIPKNSFAQKIRPLVEEMLSEPIELDGLTASISRSYDPTKI